MIEIKLPTMPSTEWLPSIAKLFDGEIDRDSVQINNNKQHFWGKYYELEKGLWFSYMHFNISDDIIHYKTADTNNNYYLIDITVSSNMLERHIKQNNYNQEFGSLVGAYFESSMIESSIKLPVKEDIEMFTVVMTKEFLKKIILNSENNSTHLLSLLEDRPFCFYETLYPEQIFRISKLVHELSENANHQFKTLFYKAVVFDILYNFLNRLVARDNITFHNKIHPADIEKLAKIQKQIFNFPNLPPSIDELAKSASMSSSKLKGLFKQIYGTSIYHYYLSIRMQEAKKLLEIDKLSISEVGYKLGYTNLSHFAQVFRKYHGVLPSELS